MLVRVVYVYYVDLLFVVVVVFEYDLFVVW